MFNELESLKKHYFNMIPRSCTFGTPGDEMRKRVLDISVRVRGS